MKVGINHDLSICILLYLFFLGEKVSLFWIAWAFVAEKVLNFKLTDQIFQKVRNS